MRVEESRGPECARLSRYLAAEPITKAESTKKQEKPLEKSGGLRLRHCGRYYLDGYALLQQIHGLRLISKNKKNFLTSVYGSPFKPQKRFIQIAFFFEKQNSDFRENSVFSKIRIVLS